MYVFQGKAAASSLSALRQGLSKMFRSLGCLFSIRIDYLDFLSDIKMFEIPWDWICSLITRFLGNLVLLPPKVFNPKRPSCL